MDINDTTREMESSHPTKTYCSEDFQEFWNSLETAFLYINLIICLLGVLGNGFSLFIYTSKTMRSQAVNLVLAGVALADLIVLATYVPQFVGKLDSVREDYPYYTAVAWITHEYFLAVFHHISIWFTVVLGLIRYVAVVHPLKSKYFCTLTRTRAAMAIIVVINLLITIPGYVDAYIEEDQALSYCGVRYCAKWKPITFLRQVEFWYQSFSKLFPSIWSVFVTIQLIRTLYTARKQRQAMQASTDPRTQTPVDPRNVSETNTTRMLVVVLLLCIVTELPPSLLYILEIFFDKEFYFQCRRPLHYPTLFMYYLSGAFNFVVYISLSKNYRECFLKLVGVGRKKSHPNVSGSSGKSNSKASVETAVSDEIEMNCG